MDIKSMADISKKWTTVTPGRSSDYQDGVTNPRKSWAANTKSSEANYEAGVQASIAKKSFGKGVDATGDAGWKAGATTKGVTRWGPGVAMSGDKYSKGYTPYQAELASLTLPPKGAKGDPRNYQRVQAVGDALHALKVGA